MRMLAFVFLAFFPSRLKVHILRLLGHEVSKNCYIGFCYLDIRHLTIGERCHIGHGNIFTRLDRLTLAPKSRINRWNRFTSTLGVKSEFVLGEEAAVTLRHYFDCAGGIYIGARYIIAGHRSSFFTHSKGLHQKKNYFKSIRIGADNYVGSNVVAAPGFSTGEKNFIGLGAVCVGELSSISCSLLVGNPARVKKSMPGDSPYFA